MSHKSKLTPAEACARLPHTGTVRVYNTHPTRPFAFPYNSSWFIFQPAGGGEWKKVRKEREATFMRKSGKVMEEVTRKVPVWTLELVPGTEKKRMPNYCEVPAGVAHKIIQGDPAGPFKDKAKDMAGGQIGPDIYHHDGYLKLASQIEADLGSEFAHAETELEAKRRKLAELEAQIAEREAALKKK